jgi:hypothetical protein
MRWSRSIDIRTHVLQQPTGERRFLRRAPPITTNPAPQVRAEPLCGCSCCSMTVPWTDELMSIPDSWSKRDIDALLDEGRRAALVLVPAAVTDFGTPDPLGPKPFANAWRRMPTPVFVETQSSVSVISRARRGPWRAKPRYRSSSARFEIRAPPCAITRARQRRRSSNSWAGACLPGTTCLRNGSSSKTLAPSRLAPGPSAASCAEHSGQRTKARGRPRQRRARALNSRAPWPSSSTR